MAKSCCMRLLLHGKAEIMLLICNNFEQRRHKGFVLETLQIAKHKLADKAIVSLTGVICVLRSAKFLT